MALQSTPLKFAAVLAASGLLAAAVSRDALSGMFRGGLQHPAIRYYTGPVADPVYELNRKLQDGSVQLKFDGAQGYLRSLLAALNIPVESQLVVFSKTSLLGHLITPSHPRTIYFNDSVVLTWIPGEPFVEFAAEDPRQGIIFYALDDKPSAKPRITRHNADCLNCHHSLASMGVPGMLVRSVLTSDSGTPLSYLGDTFPDHRSPFTERWGGWYVTGARVPSGHRGNVRVTIDGATKSEMMTTAPDLRSLQGRLDSSAYLTPYSDVVAMLVFEHQMHMMNLLTRFGWDARTTPGGAVREEANELVDYMLFVDEWPLGGSRIEGNSGFEDKFSALGPRDSKGRSLRQFDLRRHLMLYPCSYMIYSAAFDALPAEAQAAIYRRIWQILSGEERTGKYGSIPLTSRRAAVEILRETKPGLPGYFAGEVN
ncbi:MAG TPA: hypothetical protein VGL72_24960 [Bryobacteraceae bacterium]|jgi:hypothetical protein